MPLLEQKLVMLLLPNMHAMPSKPFPQEPAQLLLRRRRPVGAVVEGDDPAKEGRLGRLCQQMWPR